MLLVLQCRWGTESSIAFIKYNSVAMRFLNESEKTVSNQETISTRHRTEIGQEQE